MLGLVQVHREAKALVGQVEEWHLARVVAERHSTHVGDRVLAKAIAQLTDLLLDIFLGQHFSHACGRVTFREPVLEVILSNGLVSFALLCKCVYCLAQATQQANHAKPAGTLNGEHAVTSPAKVG